MKKICLLAALSVLSGVLFGAEKYTIGAFFGIYQVLGKKAVVVTDLLKDGPADKAGLKIGDWLVSVDGAALSVKGPDELYALVDSTNASVVQLGLMRLAGLTDISIGRTAQSGLLGLRKIAGTTGADPGDKQPPTLENGSLEILSGPGGAEVVIRAMIKDDIAQAISIQYQLFNAATGSPINLGGLVYFRYNREVNVITFSTNIRPDAQTGGPLTLRISLPGSGALPTIVGARIDLEDESGNTATYSLTNRKQEQQSAADTNMVVKATNLINSAVTDATAPVTNNQEPVTNNQPVVNNIQPTNTNAAVSWENIAISTNIVTNFMPLVNTNKDWYNLEYGGYREGDYTNWIESVTVSSTYAPGTGNYSKENLVDTFIDYDNRWESAFFGREASIIIMLKEKRIVDYIDVYLMKYGFADDKTFGTLPERMNVTCFNDERRVFTVDLTPDDFIAHIETAKKMNKIVIRIKPRPNDRARVHEVYFKSRRN